MKRLLLLLAIVACSGSTAPAHQDTTVTKPKLIDPAVSIHLLSQLDTTTAMGRASWNVWILLYSTDANQTGIATEGSIGLSDVRLGHTSLCMGYGSDFIGQRQVIVLALADTVNATSYTATQSVAQAWYAGNHTLPSGWAAIASDSVDWGVSTQFNQGHGQTAADPIRWDFTWSGVGSVTRAEAPSDTTCH